MNSEKFDSAVEKVLATDTPSRKDIKAAIKASSPNVKLIKVGGEMSSDGTIKVTEVRNPKRSRIAREAICEAFGDKIRARSFEVSPRNRNNTITIYDWNPGKYTSVQFSD